VQTSPQERAEFKGIFGAQGSGVAGDVEFSARDVS